MRCLPRLTPVLALLATLAVATATAADNACLLRGAINDDGIVQNVNYCAVNKGMSAASFRTHCQELHANHVEGLSPAAARGVKLSFQPACPTTYKGACDNAFGEKMTLQFMAGDSLVVSRQAGLFCISIDGRWR